MNKFLPIIVIIAVVLIIVFTNEETSTAPKKTFLRYNNGAEAQSLDPHVATEIQGAHIFDALYESVVTLDTKTLAPKPGMAESWDISEDKKTYTFKIRDAKWSNGDPFTAHDFVNSWQRIMRLNPVSKYVSMLFGIEGAEEYATRQTDDFNTVGIKAPDDRTLIITLKHVAPYFIEQLAHHSFFPVHKAKDNFTVNPETQKPNKLVGNGAFTLKYHVINDKLIVEKNPHYWDADNVKLDGIEFHVITDHNTALLMFNKGELDFINKVPLDALPNLLKEKNNALKIDPFFATYFYRFNVTIPPFDNVKVRQAFCHAIDRKRITEEITGCGEIPSAHLVPFNSIPNYESPKGLTLNTDKAKTLLAEAGYPNGEGFPTIEFLYNTDEDHKKIALEVAQMLKQNLNVNITLVNKEKKVYHDDMNKLNYSMCRSSWVGDYLDAHTFLAIMMSGDGNNRTGWQSKTYDEFIRLSASTADDETRKTLLNNAEKILVEKEVPILPLFRYVNKVMVSSRVQGWNANLREQYSWKELSLGPVTK